MKYILFIFIIAIAACGSPCPEQSYAPQALFAPSIDSANTDLVCGGGKAMLANSKLKSVYKGRTWKFCSNSCKTTFDANPTKYVK